MSLEDIGEDTGRSLKAVHDDGWKAKIRLCISESKDGYGVVDPEQLIKYLEMAMEGKK